MNPANKSIMGFCLLVPVFIGRLQELFAVTAALPVGKILFAVCVLLILGDKSRSISLGEVLRGRQSHLVMLLGLIGALTIPYSLWPGRSIEFLTGEYLRIVIFFVLAQLSIRSTDDLAKAMLAIVLTVFALSAWTLLFPQVVMGRIYSTATYDPNDLALLIALTMPLAYALLERTDRMSAKAFFAAGMLLMVAVSVNTGSRGGMLALAIVVAYLLSKRGLKFAVGVGMFLALLSALSMLAINSENLDRLLTIFDVMNDYNVTTDGGRLGIWKNACSLMLAHPLGTGMATFDIAEGSTHATGMWRAAHNAFLQVGVELGIAGMALFISLLKSTIGGLRGLKPADEALDRLATAVKGSLYAFCVGGFFLSWSYSYALYFILALAVALIRIAAPDRQQPMAGRLPVVRGATPALVRWRRPGMASATGRDR